MIAMRLLVVSLVFTHAVAKPAAGQEVVVVRERGGSVETARGKIEAESLAGVRVAGRLIHPADVIDVRHEAPPGLRLDFLRAAKLEATGPTRLAAAEYRALSKRPDLADHPGLRCATEFRAERLELRIDGLLNFIRANPDAWQRVTAVRLLGFLCQDCDPPEYSVARRAYEDLSRATSDGRLRAGCAVAVADLWLQEGKRDEARRCVEVIPVTDSRRAVYALLCSSDSAALAPQIRASLDAAPADMKGLLYNALGDSLLADRRADDALFAYLFVDQLFDGDPYELAKARSRLARLFHDRGDEIRARLYRDKTLGVSR